MQFRLVVKASPEDVNFYKRNTAEANFGNGDISLVITHYYFYGKAFPGRNLLCMSFS